MINRFVALIVSLMLIGASAPVRAQVIAQVQPGTASASLTTNTCAGASISSTGCIGVNLGGYKYVAVNLSGTWTGTVTFEVSVDGGTTWVTQNMMPSTGTQTAVTTATGNGVWYSTQLVGSQFRARFSTATSGTVVATVRSTL